MNDKKQAPEKEEAPVSDTKFPESAEIDSALDIVEGTIVAINPMDVEGMAETYHRMTQFIQKVMRMDVDYGIVPGTKKPSLYKPGAEKLQRFFGFAAPQKLSHSVEQWEVTITEGTFPLFHYRYTTTIYAPSGKTIVTSDGECNSYEVKYRWRWVQEDKVPKKYSLALLETMSGNEREPDFAIRNKQTTGPYGKSMEYWESWEKDIASGVAVRTEIKKRDNSTMAGWERGGTLYRIPNEDIYTQVNTIMKMAQKRSYVGAIIIAANASEYFTQDVEDYQRTTEEKPTIKTLVPNSNDAARKLMEYAALLGHKNPGEWIKQLLEENKLVWSLDNWDKIIELIDNDGKS